jgi:hypothetical protein
MGDKLGDVARGSSAARSEDTAGAHSVAEEAPWHRERRRHRAVLGLAHRHAAEPLPRPHRPGLVRGVLAGWPDAGDGRPRRNRPAVGTRPHPGDPAPGIRTPRSSPGLQLGPIPRRPRAGYGPRGWWSAPLGPGNEGPNGAAGAPQPRLGVRRRTGGLVVAWSTTGGCWPAAGGDSMVRLWDVAARRERFVLNGIYAGPGLQPRRAASGDLRRRQPRRPWRVLVSWPADAARSALKGRFDALPIPDGRTLALKRGTPRPWCGTVPTGPGRAGGRRVGILTRRPSRPTAVLATADAQGTVQVWDAATGRGSGCN